MIDLACGVVSFAVTGALFVTRTFPPSVGGMQTLAADVWATLRSGSADPTYLVAHGGTVRGLPLFVLRAAVSTFRLVVTRRVEMVITGDVVMYLVLSPLLRLLRVPHATMAMGKDVVWAQPAYRRLVSWRLPKAPLVLSISEATARAVVAVGVPESQVRVVRLGVEVPDVSDADRAVRRRELMRALGVDGDPVILLALGRLVRRKGVAWFVREVLPRLEGDLLYVVAGAGEEESRIRAAVVESGQSARVRLLGRVSDDERERLMRAGDIFVQSNVVVPGDMEGFGLVAVEAAMRGALVVAADLEGLRDAVVSGETGLLIPPHDATAWERTLSARIADCDGTRAVARAYALECRRRYSRERMGRELCDVLGLARTSG